MGFCTRCGANLVEFEAESSINTHPILVHAAFEAFRALGAATVRIADGVSPSSAELNTMDWLTEGVIGNAS